MAKKKETSSTTTTTALTKWEQRLADQAKAATEAVSTIGGSRDVIGTHGGHFTIDGAVVPDDTLPVLIIDSIFVNALYEGGYDANNPRSPICYAFGRDAKTMSPHENSEKPQVGKGELCADCEWNQWGSAGPGKKGKVVRNLIRLAVMSQADIEAGEVKTAKRYFLHVPPTSLTVWAGYVNQIGKTLKLPPAGVFTEIKIAAHPTKMFELTFSLIDKVPPKFADGIMARQDIVMTEIDFPYPANTEAEEEAPAKVAPRRRGAPVATAPVRGKAPAAAPAATSSFGRPKPARKY